MSTHEITVDAPDGYALATLTTSIKVDAGHRMKVINQGDGTIGFFFGELYLSLTVDQWHAVRAAAALVLDSYPQADMILAEVPA